MSHIIGVAAENQPPTCSKCKRSLLTRVARQGFLEENMFSRLGFYPWECCECRSRTMLRSRGHKVRKRSRILQGPPQQTQEQPQGT